MSMLSAQCDELRERAKTLRQGRWSDGADDARLMEDAADIIEGLESENAKLRLQIHWLKKGDVHAYEAGYHDGATNYELDHCPSCKNIADLQDALDENAKLRELVDGLEYCVQGLVCDCCPLYDPSGTNHRRCESLERELRVEVDA